MKKRILSMILAIVLMLTVINVNSVTVEAAGKIKVYETGVIDISKFVKSKGKLTVKADNWKITSVKNKKNWVSIAENLMGEYGKPKFTGAKKRTFKISKNCKWSWSSTDNYSGKEKYSKLKKDIKEARKYYKKTGDDTFFGEVQIFVKNNKVVRVNVFYS